MGATLLDEPRPRTGGVQRSSKLYAKFNVVHHAFVPHRFGVIVGAPRLLHARVLVCWFRLFQGDHYLGIGVHLVHWERGCSSFWGLQENYGKLTSPEVLLVPIWLRHFEVILIVTLVARGQRWSGVRTCSNPRGPLFQSGFLKWSNKQEC